MTGERIAVVGAGSWGTALANLLAKKGHQTTVWSYESEVADAINREHRNTRYLTEVDLDRRLEATSDLGEAVSGAGVILSVSPSHVTRHVMTEAAPHVSDEAVLVSASKGIEVDSLMTMAEVFEEVLPEHIAEKAAFLSGPSFALEVGRERPTAVAVASRSETVARRVQDVFQTDYFRVYTNTDVHGVELGGALKNVMAIACGVVDGLELGHNTRAALITRGLAEMTRLGVALGAAPETFAGLAGVGDLILTCTGGLSRNRSVGVELGRGRSLEDILAQMTMVAEGVRTTKSAYALAGKTGVEMPIVEEVHAVLFEGRRAAEAVVNLMTREPKAEEWA